MSEPRGWNFICDICGGKFKNSKARRTWDGLIVCPEDYDPKHPQIDLVGVEDDQSIPWSRPDDPIVLDDDGIIDTLKPSSYTTDLIQTGEVTSLQTFTLIDANADFVSAGVQQYDCVFNYRTPGQSWTRSWVKSRDSATQLTLYHTLFTEVGQEYRIRRFDPHGYNEGIGYWIVEADFVVQ